MTSDEIEVFKTACRTARERAWAWRPPFFIELDDDEWQVQAESESIIRIHDSTGAVVDCEMQLDPVQALTIARDYAKQNNLPWRPAFTLMVNSEGWAVGCNQSRFGGQTDIYVSHRGEVLRHRVNPK